MQDAARRNRSAALLSVASNTTLTIAKLVLGLVTGSVAVLSEAAHSASDLVASCIAFVAVRTSARPPDRDHPYGHEKAENLAAAIEGALVFLAGAAVAVEALRRLMTGAPEVDHIGLAVGVMAASALVNVVVSARLRRVGRETGSPAIEGDAAHLTADVWTSVGATVGLALAWITGWAPFDAIAALGVAGYVMVMGVRLVRRAGQVLLDSSLPDDEMAAIERALEGFHVEGVSFHALRARRAGSKRHVDMHMVVPPDTTVRHGHVMSGRVKGAVREALPNAEVLIHLEDH
jgi:cation diffusion facilitator family transporter